MKLLVTGVLLLALRASPQTAIPVGTIIPARFNSSVNSQKSKAGQAISARVMQNVPLPSGIVIRAGSTILGEVVSVSTGKNGQYAELSLRFDKLKLAKQNLRITTNLRALASMMEVEAAQIPPTGPDRGTPWAWSTRNLIGGEVAYGEGGPVARGTQVVGRALANGVLVPPRGSGDCADASMSKAPQALWVFSSDACGVYGMSGVRIADSGRTTGRVTLARSGKIEIRSGSGMLLLVDASSR